MTAGTRSSEFLLTALVIGLMILAEKVGVKINVETMLGIFGATSAYTVSRGIAKINTPSQPTPDAPATSPRRKAAVKKASPRRRAAKK